MAGKRGSPATLRLSAPCRLAGTLAFLYCVFCAPGGFDALTPAWIPRPLVSPRLSRPNDWSLKVALLKSHTRTLRRQFTPRGSRMAARGEREIFYLTNMKSDLYFFIKPEAWLSLRQKKYLRSREPLVIKVVIKLME